MKKILYAFRFLTILPIPWKQDEDLTKVARSMIYFPLVGLIIGIFLVLIEYLLSFRISPLTNSSIITFLWIFITGGLHLDGLSDLADGLGGRDREHRLEIMKDSRIGAFGAISLIMLIILKIVFVRELIIKGNSTTILVPLLLAPVWARNMQLISIRAFKSARKDGMGSFFKNEMREREWLIPLILSTALTIYLRSYFVLILLIPFVLIIVLFAKSISKKLEGLTGDCYGAICELSEVLFLFIFLL